MNCNDHGLLRAYLDNALPPHQRAEVAAHLAACSSCQDSLATLRGSAAQVRTLLGPPATLPDPAAALARLKHRIDTPHTRRSIPMQSAPRSRPRRSWVAAAGAALAILSLLLFPPVRAAADRFLQIFRAEQVVFLPIDPARIQQLQEMEGGMPALFTEEPALLNDPAEPRTVASAGEASQAVGFPVREPADLPDTASETTIKIMDRTALSFQVNVTGVRQVLAVTGIDDVTIPDALGEQPITVDVAPWASQRYAGENWELQLFQGHSPDVALPEGVDLVALGRAGLRVLGMDEAKADEISRQIDWTSTLVVPIPPGIEDVRPITINGDDGLLVGALEDDVQHWMLYWQQGEQFYVLQAEGAVTEQQMIAAAESMR